MNRAALSLALGAIAYTLAAWSVKPGFYEGFSTCSQDDVGYRWVSPPSSLSRGSLKPLAGYARVVGRTVEPLRMGTDDGQLLVTVPPGGFSVPAAGGPVSITIEPTSSFPVPGDLHFVTNVYRVTSTAPLAKEAVIDMLYSDLLGVPSTVFVAEEGGASWRAMPNSDPSSSCRVAGRTSRLGLFVAGYSPPSGFTIGGILPIVAAVAIFLVLVSTIPLAVLRRRQREGPRPQQ